MRWWGRVWRGPRWRRTNFHGLNMTERGGISQTGNFNLEGHGKPVEAFFFSFFHHLQTNPSGQGLPSSFWLVQEKTESYPVVKTELWVYYGYIAVSMH
jgi:hypothetical protein